ncbi:hypothetical protein EJQ74_25260 [Salmonella enterica]|nr:hypothetical protein [Salmonella enterica]ECD0154685.1 hypothetical protein [Salmonella enterica subsp. enterica]ECH9653715.1 hypothetical protein [Salmonella enterica subsp. enterica serovar Miami]ECS7318238.1 hypothetical protein [Salmonella enterica subsp. enterica serovar Miami str. CFSAN000579]EDY0939221.1 hypothetical protein [Salmonella enterica subsp. enterica serovar Florida]
MATTEKIIGRQWQQITDSMQTALIQIVGSADVCDSPGKPGEDHPAHSFSNTTLSVTPPTMLWVRSSWFEGSVRIVVS